MKTTNEIYEEMKTAFQTGSGLTLTDGGDMALRLYAAASQLYTLWVQVDFVNRQAFPQTAEGEYLDYHAQMRGLTRTAAVKADGTLRFGVNAPLDAELVVPAGTACLTAAEAEFVTAADGTIPAGSLYCDVPAVASAAGYSGNVPPESVVTMELAPTGVSYCRNPAAFTGGADAETDAALRERVLASYRRLPNGANAAYYESSALDTNGVAAVKVLPRNRGIGTVDIIIASATGIPSEALVSAVQTKLASQREICVDIAVSAPQTLPVDVTASVTAKAGYSGAAVAAAVKSALEAYFTGERLGESVLLVKLGSIIYAAEGVENYSITSPAADIAVPASQLPVAGTVTVTEA